MDEKIDWEEILEVVRLARELSCEQIYLEIGDFKLEIRKSSPEEPATGDVPATTSLAEVRSPMVGTFYRGATPEAQPLVEVGSRVTEGDPLGMVKSVREASVIKASFTGVVQHIVVDNAAMVQYGQTLMLLQPT